MARKRTRASRLVAAIRLAKEAAKRGACNVARNAIAAAQREYYAMPSKYEYPRFSPVSPTKATVKRLLHQMRQAETAVRACR